MAKTYTIGESEQGRPVFVLRDKGALTYHAFRDLGRICGKSWDEGEKAVFECLLPEKSNEVEKTLAAYGWKKEEWDPSQLSLKEIEDHARQEGS